MLLLVKVPFHKHFCCQYAGALLIHLPDSLLTAAGEPLNFKSAKSDKSPFCPRWVYVFTLIFSLIFCCIPWAEAEPVTGIQYKPTNNQDTTFTQVSGLVTDATNGQPLPYISIGFPGTSFGTSSDANGKYHLSANGTFHRLQFSYIGYQTLIINIKAGEETAVECKDDSCNHTIERSYREYWQKTALPQ